VDRAAPPRPTPRRGTVSLDARPSGAQAAKSLRV